MHFSFLQQTDLRTLTFFLPGWGMDVRPFRDYRSTETDILMAYDYSDLEMDAKWFSGYERIRIVAWSMGVWAASVLMARHPWLGDEAGLTTPAIFPFPASPHFAARLAGQSVDCSALTRATQELAARYDVVLVEGAGGLMVPLTETVLTIDYIRDCGYPVVLVTSGRLGSINHTLLSLEALKTRGMRLHALVYNAFPLGEAQIQRDSKAYFQNVLAREWPDAAFVLLPFLTGDLAQRLRADD